MRRGRTGIFAEEKVFSIEACQLLSKLLHYPNCLKLIETVLFKNVYI
jgi:hypothetical protein